MAPRALKLGTRRSALARAQSAAIARRLEQLHAGLSVELVGIDTRGDRVQGQPLSALEGKEFFTAEIDAALLGGQVDLTVHSFKDLSLARDPRIRLAAVPARAPAYDVVVFAPDVPARVAAGQELLIGSCSPRRASFVPPFLRSVLPRPTALPRSSAADPSAASASAASASDGPAGAAPEVRLVPLRGNVDSRLRRLREPRGSERHLDAVVLAFAGLARLWAESSLRPTLGPLLGGLPRMVLPLSICPPAPAQGALAVECRRDDDHTAALLAALDDPATRQAVAAEREQLAELGGGCQQRFGAVSLRRAGLGAILFRREAHERGGQIELQPTRVHWSPEPPLPALEPPLRPWDGTAVKSPGWVPDEQGRAAARRALRRSQALLIAHQRALPAGDEALISPAAHVWVPGVHTWRALAQRGVWIEGCAEGWGIGAIAELLAEPWLGLPPPSGWTVLTHRKAAVRGHELVAGTWAAGEVIGTYRHEEHEEPANEQLSPGPPEGPPRERPPSEGTPLEGPPPDSTHVYWASSAQFDRWHARLAPGVQHACGPGKTHERLHAAGVHNLRMFPGVQQWREWLQA